MTALVAMSDTYNRFDDRRGGESYRPMSSIRARRSPPRNYIRHARSPPRTRSPRLVADTWVPSASRTYDRFRSRSPASRRRSRSPSFYSRDGGQASYRRTRSPPRRPSPRRDERPRSPRQVFWRSRSPFNDGRSRDTSWDRTTPLRPREASPPSQDFRFPKRERFTSEKYLRAESPPKRGTLREYSSRASMNFRTRSPFQGQRERQQEATPKRRSTSPSREGSSTRYTAPTSGVNFRRPSSPTDKSNLAPFDPETRSPITQCSSHERFSRHSGHSSPIHERTFPTRYRSSGQNEVHHKFLVKERSNSPLGKGQEENRDMTRPATNQHMDSDLTNHTHATGTIPTQPKAYSTSISQIPPSGPSYGSKSLLSQSRGPNISLLAAPTRPRGGSNVRDTVWPGAPPRRGTMTAVAQGQGPPSGPRGNNFASTGPVAEHTFHRQNNATNTGYARNQKLTSHLAGMCSIIPGGKLFSTCFDPAVEKRLSHLNADKARLFDQVAQKQTSKRAGMKDWDRLDRESSISTLKSELAEGHLQRITGGESVQIGTIF